MDLIYIVSDDPIRGNLVYNFLSGRINCALYKPHDYFSFAKKENPHIFLFISDSFEFLKMQTNFIRESQEFYNHGIISVMNNPSIFQLKELFELGNDMILNQNTEMERIFLECYSLTRRMNGFHNSAIIQHGPYLIDFLKNEIQFEGRFHPLEPIQTKLIKLFFEHPDQLITRNHLQETVWKNIAISPRSIDAQISKFKKKFPELGHHIQSIYGKGYIFRKTLEKSKVA